MRRIDHLFDNNRIYTLCTDIFSLLNPNTRTRPVFRTNRDAQLTTKIYQHCKVLLNEVINENPWDIKFGSMFHMSGDSHLFRTYSQLIAEGAIYQAPNFYLNEELYVPLYEGKMIWLYNHHYGTWPTSNERPNTIATPSNLTNPNSSIIPWYWVPLSSVKNKCIKYDKNKNITWEWNHKWSIAYRAIMESHDSRSFLPCLIPNTYGIGNSLSLLYLDKGTIQGILFLSMMSSIVMDYITRQKLGGKNINIFVTKQLAVLTPEQITSSGYERDIVERVARLCWFNHDLDGWMEELREECPEEYSLPEEPVIWDEEQRAAWQAELDAIFAHLYGLSTEDLRYILDPEDVCGKGCINETFRVLKERELRELGEYRTKRLVMEAWNRFGFGI